MQQKMPAEIDGSPLPIMKLKEYQAKKLIDQYDIPIPRGVLFTQTGPLGDLDFLQSSECLVKSQILSGSRKKKGAILESSKKNCAELVKQVMGTSVEGEKVEEVLVEEKLPIKKEFYVGVTIDRFSRKYVVLLSKEGGIDIEEAAQKTPEKIDKIYFESYRTQFLLSVLKEKKYPESLLAIVRKMFNLLRDADATLVEINPLIDTGAELVAVDAKILIDENALYRQPALKAYQYQGLTAVEKVARSVDIHYVDLDGDIGVIGNGAGLVMATIDLLVDEGSQPANFMDLKGGTGVETMEAALETITKKPLKGLCINVFGGITHCDDLARGIINFLELHPLGFPIVVRMIGTHEKEAAKILKKVGISAFDSMEKAISEVVKRTR